LIRDMIVARFAEQLGEDSIPILQLASRYSELGERAATRLAPDLSPLGLELARFVVESIALPDEVAATLDQRTRIGLIGDVGAYAALQAADAIRDSARNPGTGGAGAAVGVGIAMAGQLVNTAANSLRSGGAASPTASDRSSTVANTASDPAEPRVLRGGRRKATRSVRCRDTARSRSGKVAYAGHFGVARRHGAVGAREHHGGIGSAVWTNAVATP
jgi:membrane protease subunit (stomatin/prohibitin family)